MLAVADTTAGLTYKEQESEVKTIVHAAFSQKLNAEAITEDALKIDREAFIRTPFSRLEMEFLNFPLKLYVSVKLRRDKS